MNQRPLFYFQYLGIVLYAITSVFFPLSNLGLIAYAIYALTTSAFVNMSCIYLGILFFATINILHMLLQYETLRQKGSIERFLFTDFKTSQQFFFISLYSLTLIPFIIGLTYGALSSMILPTFITHHTAVIILTGLITSTITYRSVRHQADYLFRVSCRPDFPSPDFSEFKHLPKTPVYWIKYWLKSCLCVAIFLFLCHWGIRGLINLSLTMCHPIFILCYISALLTGFYLALLGFFSERMACHIEKYDETSIPERPLLLFTEAVGLLALFFTVTTLILGAPSLLALTILCSSVLFTLPALLVPTEIILSKLFSDKLWHDTVVSFARDVCLILKTLTNFGVRSPTILIDGCLDYVKPSSCTPPPGKLHLRSSLASFSRSYQQPSVVDPTNNTL